MLLEVAGLASGYGKVTVLHGIDLQIDAGEIVVVLGPNGAGKSTLMKTIAGHIRPVAGSTRLAGMDLAERSAKDIARLGIGYVPQEDNVFYELTVRENLRVVSLAFPEAQKRVKGVLDRFPVLAQSASRRASTLSGGERQTLAVSSALIADPKVLLLDEPTAGLAPIFIAEIVEWVSRLAREGMAVLWVVEQNPEKILAASNRTYLLEGGRITAEYQSSTLLEPGRYQELLFQEREEAHIGHQEPNEHQEPRKLRPSRRESRPTTPTTSL